MRAIELAKVAAAAEALRLRRLARRQIIRAALGVVALLFALAAFGMLHVLGYIALSWLVAPWLAAVIVLVVDLVIAGVLVTMALNSSPDRIEREALQVRRESLIGARKAATFMAVAGQLTGIAMSSKARREIGKPGLGRYLMVADIASRFLKKRR